MNDAIWTALFVALATIGTSNIALTAEKFYAALWRRELYLTEKAKREALDSMKNPEWEPVGEEKPD